MGDFKSAVSFESPKRIGVVIRGESYRSGAGQGDRKDEVTPDGRYWQDLAIKSHLEKVLQPMEDCGYAVDVYVGTYDHAGDHKAQRATQDLLLRYAPHVRGQLIVSGRNKRVLSNGTFKGGDWGAGTMYEESFRLLAKRHREEGATYDAVLVIRHDTIFKQPLLSSFPGVDWGKVVFPFSEKLLVDSVSDVFQWFPWRYINCASECGYHGHGLGACLVETAGTNLLSFIWPGSHISNTEAEANPIYRLARPSADEKRTAVLVVGDVGRLAPKKGHAHGPFVPLRVTGQSFVEHVLKPNNRRLQDPHKHLDVFVHNWVPPLERDFRLYFTSIAAAEYDDKLKELGPTFKSKLGGGLDDWRDVAWAYAVERAVELMKKDELKRRLKYDRVLIIRPDTLLLSDLDLDDIMRTEDQKGGPIYASRPGPGPKRYLHLAMGRHRAVDFARLYSRLPLRSPPKPGRSWMSNFIEQHLEADLIEDNVTVGTDEEAYLQIPALSQGCSEAQLSRMFKVGFTAEDAFDVGLRCDHSLWKRMKGAPIQRL